MKEEQHYCEKHKQFYDLYLHECPICYGEELSKDDTMWRVQINKKEKD